MKLLIVIKEFLANPLILVLLTIITMVLLLTSCMAYPEGQRPTHYKPPVTKYNVTTGEIETIFDMGSGMSFSDKGNIYIDMP
ncbi:MAG: hypothetical protein V3U58_01585 [Thermodesulfobacteriota bacterium]